MIPAHLIDELLGFAEWQREAACRDADSSIFFLTVGQTADAARAICGECPVADECREYAIEEHLEVGIFGGTTPRERKIIRRERRYAAPHAKTA